MFMKKIHCVVTMLLLSYESGQAMKSLTKKVLHQSKNYCGIQMTGARAIKAVKTLKRTMHDMKSGKNLLAHSTEDLSSVSLDNLTDQFAEMSFKNDQEHSDDFHNKNGIHDYRSEYEPELKRIALQEMPRLATTAVFTEEAYLYSYNTQIFPAFESDTTITKSLSEN